MIRSLREKKREAVCCCIVWFGAKDSADHTLWELLQMWPASRIEDARRISVHKREKEEHCFLCYILQIKKSDIKCPLGLKKLSKFIVSHLQLHVECRKQNNKIIIEIRFK